MLPFDILSLLTRFLTYSTSLTLETPLQSILPSLSWSPRRDIVDTGYAKYLGNISAQYPDTVVYYGIPYAEPPIRNRRFRAPLQLNVTRIAANASSVIDARSHPPFCIQGGRDNLAGGAGSEDCLKVNVYTPLGVKRDSNLPVLVFFHGGGYIFGNPLNFPFDHWIQHNPNGAEVIIVSVYYRLSSFGFLAHPSFRDDTSFGDLNAGFLDQIEALRWIQRNIRSFGGDPRRVTIDGHSAGASSVELHLVAADYREGLFSQAIAQSTYRVPVPTAEQQEPLFEFYATHVGCGRGSFSEKMHCLREADVSDLARAQDLAMTDAFDNRYRFFRPVIDDRLVRDYPSRLIANSQVLPIPLLVGSTSNETSIPPRGDIEESLQTLFPGLSDADVQKFLEVYPEDDFDSAYQRFQVITGESVFICSVPIMGDVFVKTNTKVWAYRYNEPNPSLGSSVVAHSAESWMMFRGTNTRNNGTSQWSSLSPQEIVFSQELIAYWLSFVRAGDPNTFRLEGSSEWVPYTAEGKVRMVLQKGGALGESGGYIETQPEKERRRCEFVLGMVEKEQN